MILIMNPMTESNIDKRNIFSEEISEDSSDICGLRDESDDSIRNNSKPANIVMIIEEYLKNPKNTITIDNFTLDELPEVFGSFNEVTKLVVSRSRLKSLKNIPPNVKILDLRDNYLTVVISNDIPKSVEELYLNKNKINLIDLSDSPNIRILNICYNPLDAYVCFPPNVESIACIGSNINSIECFKDLLKLTSLNLNSTNIRSIDWIPDNVQELRCSRTSLKVINRLPSQLKLFVAHSSEIRELKFSSFPNSLRELDLYDNELTVVPEFPHSLLEIDLMKNRINRINLSHTIQRIDLKENPIELSSDNLKVIDMIRNKNGMDAVMLNDSDDDDMMSGIDESDDLDELNRYSAEIARLNVFDKEEKNKTIFQRSQPSSREAFVFTPHNNRFNDGRGSRNMGIVDAVGISRSTDMKNNFVDNPNQSHHPFERKDFDITNHHMNIRRMMAMNAQTDHMHRPKRSNDLYRPNKRSTHKIVHNSIYNL